jgi:molybdopterin-guanine dinucleotide biosynthesis protein
MNNLIRGESYKIIGDTKIDKCISIKSIASNIRNLSPQMLELASLVKTGDGVEGDIVLGKVTSDSGAINYIENNNGRDVTLYKGDLFLGVLGNRKSSTSEYGGINEKITISSKKPVSLDLLAAGGILGYGQAVSPLRKNQSFLKVQIEGFIRVPGQQHHLNISDLYQKTNHVKSSNIAPILLVCGTSAEVGKTTTTINLIRALKRKGLRVSATKLTGTGRLRDILAMQDAGADFCLDFPNIGLSSTYTTKEKVITAIFEILNRASTDTDIILAELGGDIIEANIPTIFENNKIMARVIGVVQVSGDVLGIIGSLKLYKQMNYSKTVYLTLPKGRNSLGTKERLFQFGLEAYDSLSDEDSDSLADKILTSINTL